MYWMSKRTHLQKLLEAMQFIDVSIADKITTITLNRPKVMNCINKAMHHELHEAFDQFASDITQRICVITGAGDKAFCAGSDLKDDALASSYPENGYAGLIERFDLNKPVIAAVNGLALGGGFEVALACDIIIASSTAKFGLPEPMVGAVALGGGLHRLSRQIGLKKAMGMILTAQPVTAEEGSKLGFVTETVEPEELQSVVDKYCNAILACAPTAIEASKQTVMKGLDEKSLKDAIRHQAGYSAFKTWREGPDAVEGPAAFTQKRKPVWK